MKKFEHDPEKILIKLVEVEKQFPVQQWKINGVSFWPFIRTSLAYTQRKIIETKPKKGKANSYLGLFKRYGKIIIQVPFHILGLKRKLKSAHRIFIGAATHRVLVKGVKVNRYFDKAITDFNERKDTSIILDRGTSLKKSHYPNGDSWFSLPAIYIYYELLRRLKIEKSNNHAIALEGYEQFEEYLLQHFENPGYLKRHFSRKAIEQTMKVFHDRKEFLKRLLKRSDVKNAYFLCYYSSLYYPLIAAFNEMGINTTDVQHGGMGKGHFSYDNWNNVPTEGYFVLPRYYWTWDSSSTDLINTWALETRFHKAFAMGTPWRNDYTDRRTAKADHNDPILVIMTDLTVEDYILKAVQYLGTQKRWVFRMHPRMVKQRNILEQQLAEYQVERFVSIEDSTLVLLNDSLQSCSVFISNSSGSVIEAIQAGITPILLPSPGLNYYEAYIKSGEVKLLTEKKTEALVALLGDTLPNNSGKVETNHVKSQKYNNRFVEYEKIIDQV